MRESEKTMQSEKREGSLLNVEEAKTHAGWSQHANNAAELCDETYIYM